MQSRLTNFQLGTRTSDVTEIDKGSKKVINEVRGTGLEELNR